MNQESNVKGGEFIIKETQANQVFIPEEFSEEQTMMAQATTEFVDREVWPNKHRFEKKDYAFTLSLLKQTG